MFKQFEDVLKEMRKRAPVGLAKNGRTPCSSKTVIDRHVQIEPLLFSRNKSSVPSDLLYDIFAATLENRPF